MRRLLARLAALRHRAGSQVAVALAGLQQVLRARLALHSRAAAVAVLALRVALVALAVLLAAAVVAVLATTGPATQRAAQAVMDMRGCVHGKQVG
jgi:hypothetical protein